ncbi:hypothetical protein L1987_68447 [Smallanthus sonchifolius]|uniref:Uncharacterized protein n=1 Tax=Smallanthus sonchifolius TaxID=185202 RepID=A0ACB9B3U9_9ASTR|nr:hypothetical protein L1987_68447 [Smallanthus sonchifolius]
MVPGVIRNLSESSFTPRVVSIGPLHREHKNVEAFEKRKPRFLSNLMMRIESSDDKILEILESCMQKVHTSMERIRACYCWTRTYDDNEVAKMMVMDACFILEFVYWNKRPREPYLGNKLRPTTIVTDLVLLENQIPFFFLDEIYKCTIQKIDDNIPLIVFIRPLLHDLNIFNGYIKFEDRSSNTIHHILSLLHQCYEPKDDIKPRLSPPSSIRSAADLDRAGINFKPHKGQTSPTPTPTPWVMRMEVEQYRFPYFIGFWGKPTLRMPELSINDSTELVLRNLIAYEQPCETRNHITSYVWALDMLVNTKEDVAKLEDSGVLVNYMGSNEEATNIINSLGNGLVLAGFFYDEQWETLHNYCNGYWTKHIAWLRRTYFNSPWNIIALLAGFVLFILTVVQTIYTIKSTGSNK